MVKKLVLMDHDGAIDDFLSLILLMTMTEVEPVGIVVTPADCYIEAAVRVSRKILDFMGRNDIPVAKSTVRGVNPFPPDFRRDCTIIDNFPILNEGDKPNGQGDSPDRRLTTTCPDRGCASQRLKTPLIEETATEFIIRQLQSASEPVTLMVTGPLTTVAEAIASSPQIVEQIAEIVWMGGALNVAGNVQKVYALEHDGTAEWNVFWDPIAAKQIWDTDIPITLCPLDLTNGVPVTSEFIRTLAKQRRYPISDLVGLCYSLAIPQDYYCWDILATAYLARPELYQTVEYETDIITTGASQGRTVIKAGGRKIKVMDWVDKQKFYSYLLQQFA